jgi:hypothetical protein
MSRVYIVQISVCDSTVNVKLHNQAYGGVTEKINSKTSAKWSTNLCAERLSASCVQSGGVARAFWPPPNENCELFKNCNLLLNFFWALI